MPDPETTLAMTAATTIVAAMTTNAWNTVKTGIARIFKRAGDDESAEKSGADIVVRLEHSAKRIADAADPRNAADPDDVRQKQIVRWQEDLEDLLHDHPDAEADLRALVETVRQELPPVKQRWIMRIEARDGGFAVGAQGPGSSVIVHGDRETPPAGDGR